MAISGGFAMIRRNWAKKTFVLWTSLFAFTAIGIGAAAATGQTSSDPIAVIPAEAMFCVRISNLDATLGQVDQFLTGIFPASTSMPVHAQLGQFLGSADAKGVNTAGSFAIFGLLPGGEPSAALRIGVLVPVTDYQQFVEGNPKVGPPDAQGISQIGEGDRTLVAVKTGDYALVTTSGNRQALIEMKNLLSGPGTTPLSKRLGSEELKRATDSPIWAYANIQVAARIVEPMIQKKLQEAKEGLKAAQEQTPLMMGQPEAIMDAYVNLLSMLMKETQFVSLSLHPSATAIRADSVVAAVPDTEMSRILSMDGSQQQPNLLGYLENGAIMNGVFRMSPAFSKTITAKYLDMLPAIMGKTASKEDIEQFKQLATSSADALAGPIAFSVLPDLKSKPPFRVRYVAVLKDKEKFYQVLDQTAKMMNEGAIGNLYRDLGLKMQFDLKRNVTAYKDVPINAIHVAMQPVDTNAPEGQMISAMFGEGFDLRLATVDNLLIYTLSVTPEKDMQALIDQVKSGGPGQAPSEVQAAMQLLPDAKNAEFFMTYNYLRVLQMVTALTPIPIPQMDVPTQSDIVIAGDIGNGKLQASVAVPKQHVLEIMTVFMKMQQEQEKMKEQQQPQQGQPQGQQPGQT
jgi:hypothetical protein